MSGRSETDEATSACHCPCNSDQPNVPVPGGPSSNEYLPHWTDPLSLKQLYCRTGYNLAIDKSGRVFGVPEAYNPLAIVQFISVEPGEVQIRSVETGYLVAMDREGKLYGERNPKDEGTIFVENFDRNSGYNNYLSRKYAHHGWYLGIKKSGRYKPGPKTGYGQKAIMFLPRQAKPSGT